jgi:hypothetical protein
MWRGIEQDRNIVMKDLVSNANVRILKEIFGAPHTKGNLALQNVLKMKFRFAKVPAVESRAFPKTL